MKTIQYANMSLTCQVQETIEWNILNEKYEKGMVLSESCLSTELGVSKTLVRQVLARLSADGLLEETQDGIIVLGVSDEDVDDYYEIKAVLEAAAARRAASEITDMQLMQLSDIIDQQELNAQNENLSIIRELDKAFHEVIFNACGSRPMERILKQLHRDTLKYCRLSLDTWGGVRLQESIREHRAIVEAFRQCDADYAAAMMGIHVENSRINLQNMRNDRRSPDAE